MLEALHPSDGSDALGERLPLTIRIGRDGRVYFHDITADLLPVALALCPDDPVLQHRAAAAQAMLGGPRANLPNTQEVDAPASETRP